MTDINIDGIVTWLSNWFQDKLVSGTNIKTVNNQSLLGSGNINISGGGGSSNLFDLNTISQYGDNAVEEGADRDGTGLGYGNDILIYNSQEAKFYYDKNSNADYDTGNELATMNDLPTNSSIVDLIYPVGSIYMSANDVNPSTLFGGTWERIEDKFLLSKGSSYRTLGGTGGSATVSLTQSQMPRHTHTQNSHSHTPRGDYDYFLATPTGAGAVTRNSTAGQSGTKVQNLLQASQGVARTNTNSVTATNKYTGGSGSSESASNGSAHENMPPYLVVNIWKRTG